MNREQQLAQILEGWLDGAIDESAQAGLLGALEQDQELRRSLAEQVATLGAIRAAQDPHPRWLALFDLLEQGEPAGDKVIDFEQATMAKIAQLPLRPWHARTSVLAAAAAVVLLAAVCLLLQWRDSPDLAAAIPPPVAAPVAPVVPVAPVAIVLDCKAGPSGCSLEAGSYLRPGLLAQADGWASIQTLHGVTITLDAPFEATLIAHDQIELRHGQVRVHVPDGAVGFRLHSPAFEIIDLGTEFAAQVEKDGTGRCRVFEGKADVSLIDSLGVPTVTRRLPASKSVRIDPSHQAMNEIDERDGDYPEIKVPARPLLALAATYPEDVLRLGPDCYWRFESISPQKTVSNEMPGARRLGAKGSASISREAGGNHAGELVYMGTPGFFTVGPQWRGLQGDFTISFFVQYQWLQNHAMISALKFSPDIEGHAFILQAYANFRMSGLHGTGLHAVVRDPPGWDGGVETFGDTLFRPQFWHHVAATRRGGDLTLFLDGQVVGSESIGDARLDFDYFYVGRRNADPEQSWKRSRQMVGHIDELAIFGRALKENEIRRLAAGKIESE